MAKYQYNENKAKSIMNNFGSAFSIVAWFFIVLAVKWDELPNQTHVNITPALTPYFQGLLFIAMVMIPIAKLFRRLKLNSIKIDSSRKGLKISFLGKEYFFAWKDLKKATIIYDSSIFNKQLFPRKIILRQGQPPQTNIIEIDNNPYEMQMPDTVRLIEEILDHEPAVPQEVIGLKNYCPWHGRFLGKKCSKCNGNITTISRWSKCFYSINPSLLCLLAALTLLGPIFIWLSAAGFMLFIASPMLILIKNDINISNQSQNKVSPKKEKKNENT